MSKCFACLEEIREGAGLCRHCGTSQRKSRWKSVGSAMKWVGAVVTVISLSMGVITLSGHFRDWRDDRAAIAEHVDAASWLIKTKHYPQAWEMLSQALELSPSAPAVRERQFDLALAWLRDFSAEREIVGETLDGLTSVLYRRLADASPDEVATILAHVARAQILRLGFEQPVFVDIDALFEEALGSSPRNPWANAYLGNWILLGRGVGPRDIERAEWHFRAALASGHEPELVRRLQLGPLASLSFGRPDEVERSALAALLRASHEMMRSSEPHPPADVRYKILDGYGVTGRGEHVESLVGALAPDEHLAVHAWLREGLDYSRRERMVAQMSYLEARLVEERGDADEALARYRELLSAEQATEQLDALVDSAIERLTGELPARALARKYIDDPVDEADPWSFHVDTLLGYDPRYRPRNLDQALEFFTVAVAKKDARVPELIPRLEEARERVRQVVAEGDERARHDAYHSGFSAGHHDLARAGLIRVTLLEGRALAAADRLDAAVASLGDATKLAGELDESHRELRAHVTYELAGAFARRAAATEDAGDRTRALEQLTRAIEQGVVDAGIASWDEIKGDSFRALTDDPGYVELIRGR